MRPLLFSFLLFCSCFAQADTIDNYINIATNIPQMEIKADQQSQVWARSARNVLTITNESIAETLEQANELAKNQGKPLFCLPANITLDAATLDTLIQETYKEISSQQSDKDKMTVSQIAWLGVLKRYPCQQQEGGRLSDLGQQVQHNDLSSAIQPKTISPMQHMNNMLNSN